MRFFTREWVAAPFDDEETALLFSAYREHLNRLAARLTAPVQELAGLCLHDGRIRRVILCRSTKTLTLQLLCGDNQAGYFDLELLYGGVGLDTLDTAALARQGRNRHAEILRDEIDVDEENRYIHRIMFCPEYEIRGDECYPLFRPEDEVEIIFKDLKVIRTARRDRRLPYLKDRYRELDRIPAPGKKH
jgi:hypothetical protein